MAHAGIVGWIDGLVDGSMVGYLINSFIDQMINFWLLDLSINLVFG